MIESPSEMAKTSSLADVVRRCLMLAFVVEIVTGSILAFVFVPDYSPAIVSTRTDSVGRPQTIYGAIADVRGPVVFTYGITDDGNALMVDTVRRAPGRMLFPFDQLPGVVLRDDTAIANTAKSFGSDNISIIHHEHGSRAGQPIVPSVASVSLEVHLADTPLGQTVRRLHFALTSVLVGAVLCLLILLAFESAAVPLSLWVPSVTAVPVVVLAAWSGRLLPDDLYALASRNIVTSELGNIPFGSVLAALFGLDTVLPSPIRNYAMHCFVLPVTLWCLQRETLKSMRGHGKRWIIAGVLFVVAAAVAIILAPMSIDPEATLIRDAVQPQSISHDVLPWWIVRPASTWAQILGADLVGYLGLTSFLAVVTMPLWRSRAPYRLPLLLISALTVIYIVGIVL